MDLVARIKEFLGWGVQVEVPPSEQEGAPAPATPETDFCFQESGKKQGTTHHASGAHPNIAKKRK